MKQVSATRLKDYLECPAMYYAKYVKNLRSDVVYSSVFMGRALHEAIAAHYKGDDPAQVYKNELIKEVDTDQSVIYNMSYAEMRDMGISILEGIEYPPSTEYIEYDFLIPSSDNTFEFRGIIDYMAEGIIIDWKSSKKKANKKGIEYDPQFIIYAKVHERIFGTWPTSLRRYHLRDQTYQEVRITPELYHQVEADARRMITDDFTNLTRCDKCPPWCTYDLCA